MWRVAFTVRAIHALYQTDGRFIYQSLARVLPRSTPLAQYSPVELSGSRSQVSPAYGRTSTLTIRLPSRRSPGLSAPTWRPSPVGWPGDTTTARPSASTTRITRWPNGAGVWRTIAIGAATRLPASTVQTSMPGWSSGTGIGPPGVALRAG